MDILRRLGQALADTRAAIPELVLTLGLLAVIVALALALHRLAVILVRRLHLPETSFYVHVLRRTRNPTRLAFAFAGLILGLTLVDLPFAIENDLRHLAFILLIVFLGWIALAASGLAAEYAQVRFKLDVEDNLQARRSLTQVRVLMRTVQIVITLVTVSMVLLTFDAVRNFGVSLLASAGAAGIVLGFAARPVLGNLIAGVQIALTQPIRLEDVVIVEDEWGWIEEIGASYVTVRLWDWRRLIVPLSYFIEQPFQNWTRESAAIIGQVTWHLDYTAPVEAMRAKLEELVRDTPLWDGKVVNLQVVEALERTIVVRALVSARNSPTAWDLRCEIREKMLAWLQQDHAERLPKLRTEGSGDAGV